MSSNLCVALNKFKIIRISVSLELISSFKAKIAPPVAQKVQARTRLITTPSQNTVEKQQHLNTAAVRQGNESSSSS